MREQPGERRLELGVPACPDAAGHLGVHRVGRAEEQAQQHPFAAGADGIGVERHGTQGT
jgi:hypothetical protein